MSLRVGLVKLLRLLATELVRLMPESPEGNWVLHLLETLSDRFIMALCTNPPRPLVGETERSGDIRLGDGGIAV